MRQLAHLIKADLLGPDHAAATINEIAEASLCECGLQPGKTLRADLAALAEQCGVEAGWGADRLADLPNQKDGRGRT